MAVLYRTVLCVYVTQLQTSLFAQNIYFSTATHKMSQEPFE